MAEDDQDKTPKTPPEPPKEEMKEPPNPSPEAQPPGPPKPSPEATPAGASKSSTGMDPKVASLLCYLLTWVSGLVFYLIEKENKDVRFHALQAILFGAAWAVIWISVSILTPVLSLIFSGLGILMGLLWFDSWVLFLIMWIMLMVRAYQGERWKLPVIGDIAERNA